MKRIKCLILCLAAFIAVNAQSGNDAYNAELDKAVALSCNKQILVETFEGSFRQFVNSGTISETQCKAMSSEITDLMYPKIFSIVKQMWDSEFTLDELRQIVAWLSSPVGKKMLYMSTKTGSAQQTLMQDPEIMNGINAIVRKYIN